MNALFVRLGLAMLFERRIEAPLSKLVYRHPSGAFARNIY